MDNESKMMTTEEVAATLRMPKASVHQLTHRKAIEYYKIGKRCLFKPETVKNYIESRRRPAVAQ